jgi:hypothetical protein
MHYGTNPLNHGTPQQYQQALGQSATRVYALRPPNQNPRTVRAMNRFADFPESKKTQKMSPRAGYALTSLPQDGRVLFTTCHIEVVSGRSLASLWNERMI